MVLAQRRCGWVRPPYHNMLYSREVRREVGNPQTSAERRKRDKVIHIQNISVSLHTNMSNTGTNSLTSASYWQTPPTMVAYCTICDWKQGRSLGTCRWLSFQPHIVQHVTRIWGEGWQWEQILQYSINTEVCITRTNMHDVCTWQWVLSRSSWSHSGPPGGRPHSGLAVCPPGLSPCLAARSGPASERSLAGSAPEWGDTRHCNPSRGCIPSEIVAGIVLQVLKDDSNSTEHVQWHKINKGGKHWQDID